MKLNRSGYITAFVLLAVVSAFAQSGIVQTTDQKFKNIQVLKGLPATELEPAMAFISGSLGVKCNYCHTNPFEKDEKQTKLIARKMMKMVFELNKGTFNGEGAVSCFTCHRGNSKPLTVPAVGKNLWAPQPKFEELTLPTVDQIIEKYLQALGSRAAWHKINTRITKASRIGADGVLVPEEIYQKSPDKLLTTTIYPAISFSSGFDGRSGWAYSTRDGMQQLPDEIRNQLKSEAIFLKEIELKDQYADLKVTGQERVNDRATWVVIATTKEGKAESLYFDATSGLLLKRYVESKTVFGMFPEQTEYDDYREIDGIKLPFLIRWSIPGRVWGRKVTEVIHNAVIDDAKFEIPRNPG